MIAGRKLLLADDSIAIQKVIDLTFTDEGMEVTTVGDGQGALEKLNHFTPDVVLADVFMPGVDGYELCKFIKENERFRGVPVILLVGSFEPFDEAEAKRAGADDVVTKPFQSIRDLVSRVGSLVSHQDAAPAAANRHSVLGLGPEESADDQEVDTIPGIESVEEQPNVKVFVEAPSMEPDATVFVEAPVMQMEPPAEPEHSCPPVIDLQTADTKKLEPVPEVVSGEAEHAVELQVMDEVAPIETLTSEAETAPLPAAVESLSIEPSKFDDYGVLDLGDIDSFAAGTNEDDFVLDVDVQPVAISSGPDALVNDPPPSESVPPAIAEFADAPETAFARVQEPLTRVTDEPDEEVSAAPLSEQSQSQTSGLSPAEIEAISRRVVEQISDKVVREIAWEVVPELSELLIKKRLNEQR